MGNVVNKNDTDSFRGSPNEAFLHDKTGTGAEIIGAATDIDDLDSRLAAWTGRRNRALILSVVTWLVAGVVFIARFYI